MAPEFGFFTGEPNLPSAIESAKSSHLAAHYFNNTSIVDSVTARRDARSPASSGP